MREDTIVVFCSDHGDFMGEHHMLIKCNAFYDCLTRVPLLLSYPRGIARRGARRPELVSLIDVMPTILRLVGLPVPAAVQGQPLPGTLDSPHGSPVAPAPLRPRMLKTRSAAQGGDLQRVRGRRAGGDPGRRAATLPRGRTATSTPPAAGAGGPGARQDGAHRPLEVHPRRHRRGGRAVRPARRSLGADQPGRATPPTRGWWPSCGGAWRTGCWRRRTAVRCPWRSAPSGKGPTRPAWPAPRMGASPPGSAQPLPALRPPRGTAPAVCARGQGQAGTPSAMTSRMKSSTAGPAGSTR